MVKIRISTFFVFKEHKWCCCSPGGRTSSKAYCRKEWDFQKISWVARHLFPWALTWNTCRTLENPPTGSCAEEQLPWRRVWGSGRTVHLTPAQVLANPAHAKAWYKLEAAPPHQSQGTRQAGQVARKGHSAVTIARKLELLRFVWHFPRNPLASGNGKVQTSKLEGIKLQLTPKVYGVDPIAAGLLRLLCFLVGYRGCSHRDRAGRRSTLTTE